jgi:hypothetical protein
MQRASLQRKLDEGGSGKMIDFLSAYTLIDDAKEATYLTIFKQCDSDQSGKLESTELEAALYGARFPTEA